MSSIISVNTTDNQPIEVYYQDEVELNLDLNLMYIKSGQKEIQDYVNNVSKPEIDNYIETEAKPIVSEVVVEIAEPTVNEYLETVTKPSIDEYFNSKKPEVEELVTQAGNYANNSQISAEASAASALSAENALTTLTTTATDSFNANAAEKQSQVDASAAAAKTSETNAKASEAKAKESETNAQNSANSASQSAKDSANSAEEAAKYAIKASFGNIGDIKYTTCTDVPNGGAWCDGAEYTQASFPDVYQMLVDGKLQKTTYTDFNSKVSANGFCDYFALDTTNKKFKVPKLLDKFVMDINNTVPVKGNGIGLGFTDGSINVGVSGYGNALHNTDTSYGKTVGTSATTGAASNSKVLGITTDSSKSGIIADTTSAKKVAVLKAYVVLYASATEASVAQAQEFMTALGGKANTSLDNISSNIDYVIEKGISGKNWYRKYKSGWLEQGGVTGTEFDTTASGSNQTITLIKPFANTSYTVSLTMSTTNNNIDAGGQLKMISKTTTSFKTQFGCSKNWIAFGQGA